MPQRIQRKRTKGWRMPEGAVYVGRPSRFGNPYRLSDYKFGRGDGSPAPFDEAAAREMAIRDFRMWLEVSLPGQEMAARARHLLRGKDLACFCPLDKFCHADVLLEIANG
jgi:hypothetical protein